MDHVVMPLQQPLERVTIALAGVSYLAFKMRDRKNRKSAPDRPVFFRRYWPEELADRPQNRR